MDSLEVSQELFRVVNGSTSIFIRCEPEEPDYTIHEEGVIWLQAASGESAQFPFDRHTFPTLAAMIIAALDGSVIIGWNFKHLVTMYRFYVGKEDFLTGEVFDLLTIERLSHMWGGKVPGTFQEAIQRLKVATADPYWKVVYKSIQRPLMLNVVPAMETCGVIDTCNRRAVYPYYEIEGQKNGRLKSTPSVIEKSFNPHNMGQDPRYKPRESESRFLVLDFKHMEVSTLAWVSQDPGLLRLIAKKRDVFLAIWETITGSAADMKHRSICKSIFLPVCYGEGSVNLAKKLEISQESAKQLIYSVRRCFPIADQYLRTQQESIKEDGVLRDHFGRLRVFQEKAYTCRNFLIQSPAATICLEKLISLHKSMQLGSQVVFHVHDGYAIVTPVSTIQNVLNSCKEVLESESTFAPGLKLRVTAKAGVRLDRLISCPL